MLFLIIAVIMSYLSVLLFYFIFPISLHAFYLLIVRKYSTIIIINSNINIKPLFKKELIYSIDDMKSISKTNKFSINQHILELNNGDKFYFQSGYFKGIADLFISKGDSLTDNYLNEKIMDNTFNFIGNIPPCSRSGYRINFRKHLVA